VLATLVIFLREGIEASMIVAILLAYLNRSGQRRYFRDVYIGVGAALLLAVGAGVAIYVTVREYDGTVFQTVFETITYLVAAVVLTYMTFWMQGHARGMSQDLQARTEKAMSRGARFGVAIIAFQAVGREGLETVVFTLAIAFSTTQADAIGGAAIGLVIALIIAFVIYKLGHRLNLGKFFSVVGVVLMLFAAGLLVDAVQNAQELHWITFGTTPLWNTGAILSQDAPLGDVLHSFFGYSDSPTVLQAVVYVLYIGAALTVFLTFRARQRRAVSVQPPIPVDTKA
jgi:high-affinity iron transporter